MTTTAQSKRHAAAGWREGSVVDFLELTPEESRYIEMRLALSDYLRQLRKSSGLTQSELAARIGSSQSRVAKIEATDPTVSLDLAVRALLALGATPADLARVIAGSAA